MTGFARLDGAFESWRWTWELKSVNGRNLEMRFRLPPGFVDLEAEFRKILQAGLGRGSVNINLTLSSEQNEPQYKINETALAGAIAMIGKITTQIECAPPRPEGILSLRGVLETVDDTQTPEQRKKFATALQTSFKDAVAALVDHRRLEGDKMHAVLATQFDEVESLTKDASAIASATPEALRARIAAQLSELLEGAPVPEERLAQEAALLALKADVREELDRLKAHIVAGRTLLSEKGPAGRQLDFLIQEFNREANTLCSKAQDMNLKRIGLDLKKTIDQLREQVQNIE